MTKVNELQARTGKVELTGTITKIDEARTFDKFGQAGRVANARIKDDTGEVTLTLWNEQIDQVKTGDVVTIHNGWVSEYRGELQLGTGKFGQLEIGGAAAASAPAAAAASTPAAKPAVKENVVKIQPRPAGTVPKSEPVDEDDDDLGSDFEEEAVEDDFSKE
jgi:replication factor A1